MLVNVVLGVLAIAYGCYTLYLRAASPDKLGKLEAMKEQWGDAAGNAVHLVAYTVAPLLVGLILLGKAFVG